MENKNEYQAEIFSNRLKKKYRLLKKWAQKNRIFCYRLYDKDIPEIPLAIDLYEFIPEEIQSKEEAAIWALENRRQISQNDSQTILDSKKRTYLHLYLYERPFETDAEEENNWLFLMAQTAANALQIEQSHVITKLRKKQKGLSQYNKIETEHTLKGITGESGQLFEVNLSDYLDTGLFLDHRLLRQTVRQKSSGKSVLNLFCYTGSFSVYSAEGRARRVESVDLSNTYLDWAKKNMELNGFTDRNKFFYTRHDVTGFLNQKNAEVPAKDGSNRYDMIILDPPTFSNSKSTENVLDINRDWKELCAKCIKILRPKGILYFSTNSRRLSFNENELKLLVESEIDFSVEDITLKTIDEDFSGKKIHRCWKITRIN